MPSETPDNIYAYSYTWTISNLAFSPVRPGLRLNSPPFTTKSLENIRWRLVLYPKGERHVEYMSLFLQREMDDSELKEIVIDFKFTLNCRDTSFGYMKVGRDINFKKGEVAGYPKFARWDSTNVLDRIRPFETFVIRCELSPSDKVSNDFRWNQRLDFKILSQNLRELYLSRQHSDVVLYSGDAEFHAHKAILASRSPKFMRDLRLQDDSGCTRLDVSSIPPSLLEALLAFLYSGKLDIPLNLLPQGLMHIAQQYEVTDLVQRLRTLPKAYQAHTTVQFTRIHVTGGVEVLNSDGCESICFRREVKCDLVYSDELVICCQVVHDAEHSNGDYVNMSFQLKGTVPQRPVSMLFTVHAGNTEPTLQLHAAYHVFESISEWHQTFPVTNIHLEVGATLLLGIDIYLCDGTTSDVFHEEDVMLPDICPIGLDDVRSVSCDFQKLLSTSIFTDFEIVCGHETFQVHKCVLCARSPVFERMMENEMVEKTLGSVDIKGIRPTVMRLLLLYMYSSLLGDLSYEDACDLYAAADRYAITILKERCHFALIEKLEAQNMERVLDFAQLHSDNCLELCAKTYIRSHGVHFNFSHPDVVELTAEHLPLELSKPIGN